MNDLETLKAMLVRAGIAYTLEDNRNLMVEEGYPGFYTVFNFDTDGALVSCMAYE